LLPARDFGVRRDYAQEVVDEALAAERRATVKRIRAALEEAGWREDSPFEDRWQIAVGEGALESDLADILDAEAER
jgi:hypothetical protein